MERDAIIGLWSAGGLVGLLALVGCTAATAGSVAVVHEAWVPAGIEVPGTLRDHGRRVDAQGRAWVRRQGSAEALSAYGGQPVPSPPEGYSGPGEAAERLAAAVADAEAAALVRVGTSAEGRALWAAWFGAAPGEAPAVWVVAGHHGDEGLGWELGLSVAEHLAQGDAGLSDRTVWVLPMANPDGVARGQRALASGLDLNRTYDVAWSPVGGGGQVPLEPVEVQALTSWGDQVRPALGLAVHSGAHNLGWVWNHTESPAPDAAALEGLAQTYAEALGLPGFWVTPGAAWYVTHGDQNDWAYSRFGVWDFTLELGEAKAPPIDEARARIEAHLGPALDLLAQPLAQIEVRDATDGAPLEAWIETGGQRRWTDPVTGLGAWVPTEGDVVVGARGYHPRPWAGEATLQLVPDAAVSGGAVVVEVGDPVPTDWGFPLVLEAPRRDPHAVLAPGGALPAPGPWSVVDADGTVHPHALWGVEGVASAEDRAQPGARAFRGGRGAWTEVDLDDPDADVVWSDGRWLAPQRPSRPAEALRATGAGCGTAGTGWHLLPWLLSLVCVAGRQV